MNDSLWAERGLTEDVLARLYTVGRKYAANRISVEHREDAIQEAMCLVLAAVSKPGYPQDPEGRFKYLCTTLCNSIIDHRLPPVSYTHLTLPTTPYV